MKIVKFQKKSEGIYTIYLDNNYTYNFYEEIILKYELLITKYIDEKQLNQMLNDNKKYQSYYQALKTLKKVIKTKEEIKKMLSGKYYDKESIDFTLKLLEDQGYLNDKNYAKSYINNAIITTTKGPKKIAFELEQKGLIYDDYKAALKEYTASIEKEKINKLIIKKIASNHNKSAKLLKQKLEIDLINNGFNKEIIKEVLLNTSIEEDKTIARKEYQKYYDKLSKKYSGKQLEYKLKQKMYSLGFKDFE